MDQGANASQGTLVRLMDKGYGFIRREGDDKDLFFHANEVKDIHFNDLKEGMIVTFEIMEGDKGPYAANVQVVADAAPMAQAA